MVTPHDSLLTHGHKPTSKAKKPQNTTLMKPGRLAEDGFCFLLQLVDDARVQKRGGVAQIGRVVLCDLPEDAAHDLAAASLGQSAREDDLVGLCKGPYGLPDGLFQLLLQCVVALHA